LCLESYNKRTSE